MSLIMSDLTRNKIEYIVVLINEFAKKYSLTDSQSYNYIKRYGGIDLIDGNYNVMHTLDMSQIILDIAKYCNRFGGKL